jgi:hypothetical protein
LLAGLVGRLTHGLPERPHEIWTCPEKVESDFLKFARRYSHDGPQETGA